MPRSTPVMRSGRSVETAADDRDGLADRGTPIANAASITAYNPPMKRFEPSRPALRRRAVFALATFVAMVWVTLLAPFVHPVAFELVCSAQGSKIVAHEADGSEPTGHTADDHAAHCALCLPVAAPPPVRAWHFDAVQPLAHVRQGIPAARLASLVGAPLPARGPPLLS